ncbi:related to alcohol dehydrogenase [Fusarium proliferatum]|nr:related to alcohol dehydrogenase [Fusarium proliferatum]
MPQQLTIDKIDGKPGSVYYPLRLREVPRPIPGPNEYLVRIHTAAINHRDFFIRQHLYPAISFTNPLLADGYGTVVEAGLGADSALLHTPVLLTPCRGWHSSPDGPDGDVTFATLGGTQSTPLGTAQDYIVVHESEVEPAPKHLSPTEAAALPLVGLTGWRALVTKSGGNAEPGRNILITGIGGGVALQVLQFAVARGCNVWVTSGDEAKIHRAVQLGARGGVLYRNYDWDKELLALLPASRPYIDAIIDGAGGDIVRRGVRLLRTGGIISSYGMTVAPKMDWLMQAVMKNIELHGSTMGSREEFREMIEFVRQHRIKPVVSRTVKGLDNLDAIDGLFQDIRDAKQFGKLVIEISSPGNGETMSSKL